MLSDEGTGDEGTGHALLADKVADCKQKTNSQSIDRPTADESINRPRPTNRSIFQSIN
jgi:hypothetical protein